jgi:hypothetical protein
MAKKRKPLEDKAVKRKPAFLATGAIKPSGRKESIPASNNGHKSLDKRDVKNLSNAELRKLASKYKPPSSWLDEDMNGFY